MVTPADREFYFEKHDTCPQKAAMTVIDEWCRPNSTPVSTITRCRRPASTRKRPYRPRLFDRVCRPHLEPGLS